MAARETGVVRQRLDGDTAAAQRLNGIARTQLGILKELMAFGGLQQLSRTVRLGDGTEIFVQSIFGQDTVRITPPVTVVEAGSGAVEAAVGGKYVFTLAFTYGADGIYALYRCKVSADGRNLLNSEIITRTGVTEYHMSDDGSVIAFAAFDSAGYGHTYRWTAATGAVDLGIPYWQSDYAYNAYPALRMSSDGSVVAAVGYHEPSATTRMYRWTAATGTVDLGVTLLNYGGYIVSWAMSKDGSALIFYGYDYGTWQISACCWRNGVISRANVMWSYSGEDRELVGMSDDGSRMFFNAIEPYVGLVLYVWNGASAPVRIGAASANQAAYMSGDGSSIIFTQGLDEWAHWSDTAGIRPTGVQRYKWTIYWDRLVISHDGSDFVVSSSTQTTPSNRVVRCNINTGERIDLGVEFAYNHPLQTYASDDFSVFAISGIAASAGGNFQSYRASFHSPSIYLGNSMVTAMGSDGVVMTGVWENRSTAWTPSERIILTGYSSFYDPTCVTKVFYE